MMDKALEKQLIELHKACFNDGTYAEHFFAHRLPDGRSYVIEEDGEVKSACYARFFDLVLGEREVKIPFLTGVATSPSQRYKGYARKIVETAKESLAKEGYPFVLLHPFNHDFYRKLGFETINYVTRIVPKKEALPGVTFKQLLSEDLPLLNELYSNIVKESTSYKKRSLQDLELLIGYSLKHGGFGYLIYENGNPKGYVWCEDGVCVEAIIKDENLLNGIPLPEGYTIPILSGTEDYSMGALLGLPSLLQSVPYCKEANGEIKFAFMGTNYKAEIRNGNLLSLLEDDEEAPTLSEKELIQICLGQGRRIQNNPFRGFIPEFNLACYEIY